MSRLRGWLYVHHLVASFTFERAVIVIVGSRNRTVAAIAGRWSGLGNRERVIRQTLWVYNSRIVVTGKTEVERDLNVGRKLLLEQGEEIIVRNLGEGHWGLRNVPEGH